MAAQGQGGLGAAAGPVAAQGQGEAAAAAAEAAARAAFLRDRERHVTVTAQDSLFCVIVKRRQIDDPDLSERYQNVANKVLTEDKRRCRGIKNLDDPITAHTIERQATGFVVAGHVADYDITLRVLTCAHVLSDIYTAGLHNQFTVEEVNSMFSFDVHCYHHELFVRTREINQTIAERTRHPAPSRLIALDTEKDLMVLEFGVGYLVERDESDVRGQRTWCQHPHPVIRRANADPDKMQKLVLAGWPPQRAGSSFMGQVSFCRWTYDAITAVNFKGYNMVLLEIPSMAGEGGFSGAPVLNSAEEYVGVFHGVYNLNKGYAISWRSVRDFLQQHNVLVWGDDYDD